MCVGHKLINNLYLFCDEALDRARKGLKLSKMRGKGPIKKKKGIKPDARPETLHLKLDIRKVRLSHLLQLKTFFRASPGKSPLCLGFWSEDHHYGNVVIETSWGVEITTQLKKELDSHPAVIKNWTEINSHAEYN